MAQPEGDPVTELRATPLGSVGNDAVDALLAANGLVATAPLLDRLTGIADSPDLDLLLVASSGNGLLFGLRIDLDETSGSPSLTGLAFYPLELAGEPLGEGHLGPIAIARLPGEEPHVTLSLPHLPGTDPGAIARFDPTSL
jgi:hypothetical protein